MKTDIEVLGTAEAKKMFESAGDQANFALVNTLNRMANLTQARVRNHVSSSMIIRQSSYILNSIYRKPGEDFAKKKGPYDAAVRINEDRDELAKFEEGGVKTGGAHRIAIPIDVRKNKRDIVTTANRPKALLTKKGVVLQATRIIQFAGRVANRTRKVLFVLRQSVRIPKTLGMAEAAQYIAANEFDTIASEEINRALATAIKK